MSFDRNSLLLYAVTDRKDTDRTKFLEQIEAALEGGVTILQLREKNMEESAFTEEAIAVKKLCRKYGVPLIINDNLTVALNSGADGIHVGIEDMSVSEIRKRTGKDFIIGATAKTVFQAQKAQADRADYLGVGAVFPSSTKNNAIRITNEQLRKICSSVSIPAVAIGGINLDNADAVKGSGISGIAVVSAIFGAEDIKKAAENLKKKAKLVTA